MKTLTHYLFVIISFTVCLASTSFLAEPSKDIRTKNDILASEFYDMEFEAIDGRIISLSDFKGKFILIVNTASKCGYTKQYQDLQSIHEEYKDDLVVIGFPCNDFGSQEKGSNKEILNFCQKNYGVEFLLSKKIKIKGEECHPIFTWLTKKSLNGVLDHKVSWNFNKFLISRNGNLLGAFSSSTKPHDTEIINQIK
tara:strand:+ start:68 stop:655 length:588 start_codon:yes stop_codon:yes gene_type:complete